MQIRTQGDLLKTFCWMKNKSELPATSISAESFQTVRWGQMKMNQERTASTSRLLYDWKKTNLCLLCQTPQSQKINAEASVSHAEGSTEHLISIEFPASEWTKGAKNASRAWRGRQKSATDITACMQRELLLKASFTSIKSGTPKETCRFVGFSPRRLSWLQASLPLTRRRWGRGDSPLSHRQRRRKLPSEFMQGARSEGAEGGRLTSSCSITPDVILLIMQIKCRNSSQDALSHLAILKA